MMLSPEQCQEIYEHQSSLLALIGGSKEGGADFKRDMAIELMAISLFLASQALKSISFHTLNLSRWADHNWDLKK